MRSILEFCLEAVVYAAAMGTLYVLLHAFFGGV